MPQSSELPFHRLEIPPAIELTRALEVYSALSFDEKHAAASRLVNEAVNEKYSYYDKFKRRAEGIRSEFSSEELWSVVKFVRNNRRNGTEIYSANARPFFVVPLSYFAQVLHEIDMQFGRAPIVPHLAIIHQPFNRELLMNSLMEESISSSMLEGATTTRLVAKRMLQENRKPRTDDEQMIANNYAAMVKIQQEYSKKPLTLDMIFDLHETLLQNTKHKGYSDWREIVGRLRRDDEDIVVAKDNVTYHIPPQVAFVSKSLEHLISLANQENNGEEYTHPVIRAILIHFWIGYLHPFVDGNGRLARALFYWYLIRHGYPAFGYLPISRVILESPSKYSMAYIYSEQDDNDATYFVDFHLQKIQQAIREFREYLLDKEEKKKIWLQLQEMYQLNERQLTAIRYLNKNGVTNILTSGYQKITGCTLATAIKDLRRLVELGLVEPQEKQGTKKPYILASKGRIAK